MAVSASSPVQFGAHKKPHMRTRPLGVATAAALALGADTDDALAAYDLARRPRTQRLAASSGRLARILQLGNPVGIRLRDALVRAVPAPLLVRFAAGAFDWVPPTPSPAAAR